MTALYAAHAVGLIRLGFVMLGDRGAAEDVVQDAFLGLYRNWDRLDDPANALSYVRSSVLNGCRSALRTRARRDRRDRAAAALDGWAPFDSAEAAVLLSEEHQEVLTAVRRLPGRQREALTLRFYLGLSPDETARVMGISTGTVATTQFFGVAGGLDASHVLAWTGPQDAPTGLAFGYEQVKPGKTVNGSQVSRPTFYGTQLRYLPLSAPSGTSLLSDSTSVPLDLVSGPRPAPASLSCTVHAFFDLTFTDPTGKAGNQSLICAATGSTRAHGQLNARLCAAGQAWAQIGLMKYQLGNGKPSGTLVTYASACTGPLFTVEPLWTNAAGTIQLGFLGLRPGGTDAEPRFGVFENGTFTPLPFPPGEHVSEDLAFFNNIAW